MKVELSDKDLQLLDSALSRALDDVTLYLEGGSIEDDYVDDTVGIATVQAQPEAYRRMRQRIIDALIRSGDAQKYTVVLIYPDFIATQYGEEFYVGITEAEDPESAVPLVQAMAKTANSEECEFKEDFAMVSVFEGECTAVMTRNFS